VVLLKSWKATDHSAALKAERAFKKLTRQAKELKLKSRAKNDPVSRLLRGESAKPMNAKRTRTAPETAS
jgi:predicted GIY-YIG superfamily endonuclease